MKVEQDVVAVVDGFFLPWHAVSPNEPASRTKEVAYAEAAAVVAAVRAGTETLEVAFEMHDGRSWIHDAIRRGTAQEGYYGLAKAALALATDEVSNPVETPQGFAVVQRRPYFRVRVRHVLVLHQKSPVAGAPKDRPPAAAVEIAAKAREEMGDDLSKWPEIVAKYSDEPESKRNGGSMGDLSNASPGSLRVPPEIEALILRMKPGEVSAPFSSRVGVHVLWRVD
jgi:hypothetical protein